MAFLQNRLESCLPTENVLVLQNRLLQFYKETTKDERSEVSNVLEVTNIRDGVAQSLQ
jgi:hypothetical protein